MVMGAVIDCRKRPRFFDLGHRDRSSAVNTPCKKFKPLIPPFSRHLKGTPRRSFGMGISDSRFLDDFFSSDWVSWWSRPKKNAASVGEDESGGESWGWEEYWRWLFGSRDDPSRVSNDRRVAFHSSICREAVDLSFVSRRTDGVPDSSHVVNRRVEDASKIALESRKRIPFYKYLYEAALRKHDPILRRLESEQKVTEEKLSGYRSARERPPPKSREDLHELFSPLTEEEEDKVTDALYRGESNRILVTHKASNLEINKEILQCLQSGGWLNDEVINLYLELLKERERREPKKFLKCHFFNTFFYKKLISGDNGYDYKAVRRWTTQKKLGYGLIECDKIFVPIHRGNHWCLAVINVKSKSFQYLDSFGRTDFAVLEVLGRYLMDEVMDKSNKEIDMTSWKIEQVDGIPKQRNGWDCGMFMLKYIDFYSRDLSLCFGQEHMEYFRKRTAKEILQLRAD
ncbi:Ubiquitin-like-specific protease ESD4 [Ananas comosus]|uniref:Ubiquitin-like-specific protease ESD4 n=1 Tax=Ananas comosus TaxID=4615 RepID=A0A199W285_ANACO|nr:Ubiquitin-like-specific protease ESD4 [Ananas comosus]